MSVVFGESVVNTFTAGDQHLPRVAVLADGSYVVTWQSAGQDGSSNGIYAQRFTAAGAAFGPEWRVNQATEGNQHSPRVASLGDGGFLLLWQDDSGVDGSGQGVIGQRYDAAGTALGGQFVVNSTTSSTQYDGAVAGYGGGFATVWSSANPGGNGYDVYLKRFDNSGTVLLDETRISTVPGNPATAQASTQDQADIAARADGSLVVVWTDQGGNDGSSYGVYGRTVAADGTLGATFLVNTTTSGNQYEPAVALLSSGGFVVVWRSDGQDGSSAGVFGQRFDAAGGKLGGEFLVNESTNGGQYQPAVTGLSGGGFVVSWYNDNYDVGNTGSTSDVYIREFSDAGMALTGQQKLVSGTNSTEYQPAIADLGNGNFVVVYADYNPSANGGANTYEIAQQVFGGANPPLRQADPLLGDFTGTVTFGENLVNATPQVIDAAVSLSDIDSADFDGGRLDLYHVQGGVQTDQLGVRHQGNGFGQIGVAGSTVSFGGVAIGTISGGANGANGANLVISFNANATVDAVEALVQNLTFASTDSSPQPSRTVGLRISDGDGGSSEAGTVTILVTSELDGQPLAHAEELVNTYRDSTQDAPAIAVLADGSYVIAWDSSGQDGSGTGVYWQRFAANGTAIGPEVRAAAATEGEQRIPQVAALGNGGFVLVWEDTSGADGSGQGLIGQRYDAAGLAQGGNFVVNSTTGSTQFDGAVAGYAGGFAAVWSSAQAGGSSYDIILKRFDNSGAVVLDETRISTVPGNPAGAQSGNQDQAQLAARSDGSLVIVWADQGGNDGSSYGVYGRTVAANGTLGDSFLVNTFTPGAQYEPAVALLSNGGFVVVWRSDSQDGSSAGVYGQRFDAAGGKLGAEFLVNESTNGGQYQPAVTGLSDGGFVVSWYNDNYDTSGTGTSSDVYIREFGNDGVALDGQRKLVSGSNSTEYQPAIADLGNGNFVVAYADYNTTANGGANTYEIAQQVFGSGAALARQAAPTLGDFTGTVTFDENLVNSAPQLIDAAVSLSDLDSANFGGGRLDLYYVQGGAPTDQLGVRHGGNGFGQIGLSGATVSFGGVAIGTVSGGANGANGSNLVISFNANATVDAVEALVQHLTYASQSQSPLPSRTVGLRISDGDGGSSEASTVTIEVTSELDGRPLAHGEELVNTYRASTQDLPAIAVLADGSYVIAWDSQGQDGGGTGVYWQRFAANGTAIGPEVRAAAATEGEQRTPQVAALGNGGFVLVWQDTAGADGSGQGLIGQRYDAAGLAQGGNFVVNSTTSGTQYDGAVAGYAGGFASVWSSSQAGGNGYDIILKRFDNSGAVTLAETRISTVPGNPAAGQTGTQEQADVVARADGSLVIVWTDQGGNDGSSYGVYGRTVAANGTLGDSFLVNTFTPGAQYEPAVAVLGNGGFVVVWRSDNQDGSSAGVYGQRFDAAGVKVGAEFLVNESTNGGQYQPAVTGLSGGGFVVSWYNDNYDTSGTGTTGDVYIREFGNDGVALDGQRKLVSGSNSTEQQPAIADLGNGNFVVAYADYNTTANGGANTYEIAQQVFGSGAALARQAAPLLGDFTGTVTFGENLVNSTPQRIDASVSLSDPDSANFGGGRLDLYYVQGGEATDQLGVRHEGNGGGQIGVAGATVSFGGVAIGQISGGADGANLVISFNANASLDAVEALVQNLTYANTSQSPQASRTVGLRISDGDGGSSEASTVTIQVTSELDGQLLAHGEQLVNSHEPNAQSLPDVAVLAGGSYVIAWQSQGQDGNGEGVYLQRFAPNGTAIGPEVRAATAATGSQQQPQLAALSDGGFVLVWDDTGGFDGSGQGVIGQRYDVAGTAQGGNFVVNSTTNSTQYDGAVAGYAGGFASVWSSSQAGGSGHDIILKRFDNSGAVTLAETRISTVPGNPAAAQVGTQEQADMVARADGSLVIVWTDQGGNDGNSYGIYGRTVAANGTLGDTFLVNTYLPGAQYEPAVALLNNGGFVVVWRSDNQDGSSAGVYGQRFDAAGVKVGAEFLVNESTTGGQYQPAVTGLSGGGFVVSWYNDNYDTSGTGTTADVYIREFGNDGVALDGQRKLVSGSNSTEQQPAIADLGNGNFVVAYADYNTTANGGNNTYEIAQQIFGSGASLARQADPVLGDLASQVTFSSDGASPVFVGVALPIDTDVSVTDADSANFAGGALTVQLGNGATPTESLGVRNQGNAAGQIGLSGSTVSFGGTAIGTVSGGGAGASLLVVQLNANADAAAVRALVENITYQNSSPPAGTTDRSLSLRISDGDGGVSAPASVLLRIQASVSPSTALVLNDLRSELAVTESQAQAGVLVDDAVQLDYGGAAGFANGRLTVSYVGSSGRPDDQLSIAHEGNGAGQVGVAGAAISYGGTQIGSISATLDGAAGRTLEITFTAGANAQAIEEVIERLRHATTAEAPNASRELRIQVADAAGALSPARDITLTISPEADPAAVQPLTGDLQANSQEGGQQADSALARLAGPNNGGYVVAWVSDGGQDGSGSSVHVQRFAANGASLGAEVQVNSYTQGTQNQAAAGGLADGGFVVAWVSSHDGSGTGVFAQRFDASGQPVGGEFRVNTTTVSSQTLPTVLGLADGSFVVAFETDYSTATAGYTYDVLGQRHAADGTPLGGEFTLNSNVNGSQTQPALASLSGGGFVGVWTDSSGADGSGAGIVLQRFAADGSKLGTEAVANTTSAGTQQGADVVGLAGGGFVVVWHDSSTSSVLAQRFAADGSLSGPELLVSTVDARANYSSYARVAALESGGFVVAWDATSVVSGSNYEVVAQQFDAAGQRVDGVFLLNQRSASTQIEPDIVGLAGGNFVASWSNYDAERNTDNTYGVFHRVFGTPGSVVTSAPPVLVDLAGSVGFDEALVNAGGQLIDGSVGLSDADSANFDGGRLWVSVITGYPHDSDAQLAADEAGQDVLGLRSVGNGPGQVSVSGSTVRVGGVAVGVIELNGAAGADLVIRFNADAGSAAVEAVIEHLTYANTSSAPAASRVVSISVSDGDGATSEPRLVTVNITPQADGPQPLFGNEVVNTFRPGTQGEPAAAALEGGGYLIVWTSAGQDGALAGVFGQRYTAAGERVGPEFQVNTQTLQAQDDPSAIGLSDGGFLVAWISQGQDGSGTGIYGQRFDAAGVAVGSEFRLNSTPDNNQSQVDLAALPGGGFVATWYSNYFSGNNYQIIAQRFDAANAPVGPELVVNGADAGNTYQAEPTVAAAADGSFLIVWRSDGQDGSGTGVYGQRFAADGSAQGAEFRVHSYTEGNQYQPDVAALEGGGYLVVWRSDSQDGNGSGVYGQRLDAAGAPVGDEFRVNAGIVGNQYEPSVTAMAGGGFAVAWNQDGRAMLQQFAADGSRVDGELRLDMLDASNNVSQPQVIGLAGGGLLTTWRDYISSQADYEVVQQLLADPATTTRQARPVLTDLVTAVTFAENLVNATPQLIDASVDLSDADSANFDGGQLWVSVISGYGNLEVAQLPQDVRGQDQLGLRSSGDGPGQVRVDGMAVRVGGVVVGMLQGDGSSGSDLVVRFNGQATAAAVEAVVEALTYANSASAPVGSRSISISVSDGDGGTSEPRVVTIEVTPEADGAQALFGNEVVNTYAPNTQSQPAVTRLADGGYVIVWTSHDQDGWDDGVHAQRFDANGVPVGSEFQANTYTPYNQNEPTAAGLADGGFVLLWTSANQDGSGAGVFGQRFDADGVPVGVEFLVNTATSNSQSQVDVAGLAGGGFVATWYGDFQDGNYYNIYAQRFGPDGAKLGGAFVVNDIGGGENFQQQHEPAVAALADGGFVIVFQSEGQDGNGTGVFGQRYAADGSALGAEFQVNSYTLSTQSLPDVAALSGGGFVVVWRSEGQDGSSGGIFGQRYGSDGAAVGSEFRVNVDTVDNETEPAVTALSDGGFVVSYSDGGGIKVQQFDAAGRLLDNETRVDTDNNSNATQPAIQGLADGGFVVAWTDYDAQAGQYQIYQQVFGDPALVTRQSDPLLVDVASSVTFAENLVNAVPQLIDPGVGLIDIDSPDFDGGLLEVNYLTDYGAQDQLGLQSLDNQDQLGIRHEGLGAGQVGVVGNVVSYGGVAIGEIISAGANGDKLSVRFNADASVDAVEQVIENLTYANTVSNPIASRTISIRVTDGDGGASAARAVTINVTPQTDGAVRFGQEQTVNTTRAGQQAESDIARLADGGYVVVWTDQGGADGSSYGVYGQRYDADDNAVGAEFRVNTETASTQDQAQVVGLAGGGHVVVWQSQGQDGSGWGVYGQRYNADGSAAGAEFRINTLTVGSQYQPALAATADGGFIVAWYHEYYSDNNTEYADVLFQRYGANGAALGGETKANPGLGETFRYQSQPALAVLEGGSFVVVWTDSTLDGNSSGVFGQRFDAGGSTQGSAFAVNAYTESQQEQAAITALKDGGFLVSWQSYQQDLSGWGVYAQRFDAAGNAVGAEFRVNTTISSSQYDVDVTALENGGWVVAWHGDNTGDVFLQQYNGGGQAVDGETRINSYQYSTQSQPAISSMADGGFVVSWSSYLASGDGDGDGIGDGGNDTYEIRLQRFSNTAPQVSDVVAGGQEDTVLVLGNSVFEAGFADIDGQTLQAIRIITLPGEGMLRLGGAAVVAGQEISLAQLQAGQLTYLGNADYFGTDQFRWTGSDGTVFASTPVFTTINLANVNDGPRLQAGTDDTASEGVWFNHSITLGDPDPEGHRITVDWGDGQASQVYTVGNTPNHTISHYFADNGSYTVTVSADDQRGLANSIETDSFTVVVANVAPTLNLFGAANTVQGELYTLDLGNVIDSGADTVTEYRIDWGDGSPLQIVAAADLPANRELQHRYESAGPATIRVTLQDEDGVFANAGSRTIDVVAPAEVITVDAGADLVANEGTVFTRTVSFTDPADQAPAGRSYTVNWGDGQTSSGSLAAGVLSFNISHAYADDGGSYTVQVTVDDSGAQQGSDSFVVQVANVAPTLQLAGAGAVAEGSAYTMTLNVIDPGADTVQRYNINWGDGSPVQTVLAADLPPSRQLSHVYADGPATRTINVSVVDEDGTWANAGTRSVLVQNVAPSAAVSGNDNVAEGASYVLTVGAITDPGADTRSGYSIDWGDGTVQAFTPAQWTAAAGSFSHVYADGGNGGSSRTVVVTTTDEDGSFALGSKTLRVDNVAPLLDLTGAARSDEGATYTLAVSASDAAGALDVLAYSIDWGDGSAVQTLTAAQLATLGGNLTHVFADDQDGPVNSTPRTISVTANDGDGGSTTRTQVVAIDNVAPLAAVSGAASVDEAGSYTLTVGTVVDPGADTRTGYSIDWGDGTVQAFTPAQWSSAAGSFSHVYADGGNGGTARTVTVSATDEDGTFVLGTQALTVNNLAPTLTVSGAGSTNEGATYTLVIAASDAAGANDPLGYSIDWGDGSALQTLTAAQLAALNGNVTHVFADDENGPVNSSLRTVSVTANDGDGGLTTRMHSVNVNNVAPVATVSGAGAVDEGASYVLNVGAITDPGADTRSSYSIDWGDGTVQAFTPAQWSAAAGSFTHVYADGGNGGTARTATVSATDEDGTFVLGTQALTVNNLAPTLTVSGAGSTNEGATYTLAITASDAAGDNDPLSYSIDWGDGSALQTLSAAQLTGLGGNVTHVFADDQDGPVNSTPRSISVTANDGDGGQTTRTQAVNVNNVAPTLAISGAAAAVVGQPYVLALGAITDPGTDTVQSYVIDWGDGSTQTVTTAGNVSHSYAGSGNRSISVTVIDEDGTHADAASLSVSVGTPTPQVSIEAGGNVTLAEGQAISRNIVISDGEDNGAAGWSYSVDYGDGSAVQTGTTLMPNVALDHVYADGSASHTVTVVVTDVNGETATDSFGVTVDNVAPSAAVSGADAVAEGAAYTLTVGAITDPGADTRTGYSIDWGDGTVQAFTPAQWTTAAGSFSHVYADGGNGGTARTVTVSATDEDGTFVLGGQALTVNNLAPTLSVTGAANVNEGATYTLAIAASDAAGASDPLGYSIDWGDGSALQTLTAAQLAALNGNVTHVFADDENGPVNSSLRTVSVTANDGDGGLTTRTQAVNVNNVAPAAAVSGAASVDEGTSYTLTVGALVDPGADTRTGYSIDWGDGTVQAFTPAQWTAAAGSFSHVYADGGNGGTARTVTVSATDEDGTFVLGTQALTVNNLAPTLTVSGAGSTNEGATYTLTIAASDAAGVNDPLNYTIDWGDGSALQTLTAAQLAGLGGNVTHVFADDQDGPVNSTPRSISVTANDGDGGQTIRTQAVSVNNVAPTLAISGAAAAVVGQPYVLALGAVTDPGTDTVQSYIIDWGDGSTQTVTTAGNVSHSYAGSGNRSISVTVIDEDGTHADAASLSVSVGTPTPQVSIEAGGNVTLAEGQALSRNIVISDGEDNGAAGWSYSVDYGDGSAVQTGTTLTPNVALDHVYADGSASHTVTVTVTDVDGETATDSFGVTVDNVAPSAAVSGAASVDEGGSYTLTVGTVVDPGADTRTSYSINWGDGTVQAFTPAQWSSAAGSFSHVYADGGDGGTARTVTVSATDEDGTFVLGAQALTVNNLAPTLTVSGAGSTNEGATYTLAITASDAAGANDPLSYSIDWGDGSALQTLSAAQLAALNGNVTHVFADDEDGPVNSTARSISVTANDGDGGQTIRTQAVTVNNVAPTLAISGAAAAVVGQPYVLALGAITDPGTDTVQSYVIDWGDGSTQTVDTAGNVSHSYAATGSRSISVTVIDEDGTHADAASLAVNVGTAPVDNTEPVAVDDALAAIAGQPLTISYAQLLANDTDADGQPLSITAVDTTGLAGSLTVVEGVGLRFEPVAGFTGSTGFSYTVSDGAGGTDLARVTIEVQAPPVESVRIGDAPVRQSGTGGQWAEAWSHADITLLHKADATDDSSAWSAVSLHGVSPQNLSGGDIYQGDLGVSGQSIASSSVRQEIDGREVLRVELGREATQVELALSRFFVQDDGGLLFEGGRLRLLDSNNQVVAERAFTAANAQGTLQLGLEAAAGFHALELSAGAYQGDSFEFGAYADGSGSFAAAAGPDANGVRHGSDFMLDWIEFEFPVLGVLQEPGN